MHGSTRSYAGVAATGIAVVGIAAMAATPLAPVTQSQSPPTVAQDVRLAAATVPPAGSLPASWAIRLSTARSSARFSSRPA